MHYIAFLLQLVCSKVDLAFACFQAHNSLNVPLVYAAYFHFLEWALFPHLTWEVFLWSQCGYRCISAHICLAVLSWVSQNGLDTALEES